MNGVAYLRRAEVALELQRYDEAAKEAGLAIAGDPENAHAYFVLASALLGQKLTCVALETIDLALQKQPNIALYHAGRSDILRALIEYDAAMESAETCLRLAPHAPMGHVAVGLCAREKNDRPRSVEAFKRALALNPNVPDTQRLLADAYLALKDYKLAEAQYRSALSLNPNCANTLNNLGVALKAQRKSHEAILAFKAALLLDPAQNEAKINAHASLGALLGRAGPVGLLAGAGALLKSGLVFGAKAPFFFPLIAAHMRSVATWAWLAITGVVVLGGVLARQRWNRRRLERADPQLLRIYQHLDADKKAGRF